MKTRTNSIVDYLVWRGDLSLRADSLNMVDHLVFATLSYVRFADVVPSSFGEGICLADAADAVIALCGDDAGAVEGLFRDKRDLSLLHALRESVRFGDVRLSGYVDVLDDETDKQFSALVASLSDGTHLICFRGTDSTITGWKEDLNMGFETEVPAQASASVYLADAAAALKGPLRICGHSKGGNLAIYATVKAKAVVRRRIKSVFNGDGPGFLAEVLQSDAYHAVADRINTFIPESSVIGMLMDHEDDYTIVKSSNMGLLQHEPYSWELTGNRFDTVETTDAHSKLVDMTLKDWCMHVDTDQRRKFIDGVYQLLANTDAQTLSDLFNGKNSFEIIKALPSLDKDTRDLMMQAFGILTTSARDSMAAMAKSYIDVDEIHLPDSTRRFAR